MLAAARATLESKMYVKMDVGYWLKILVTIVNTDIKI